MLETEALDRTQTRDLHNDTTMLYVIADKQGVMVNLDTLGNNGFQLYLIRYCFDPSRKYV